jgi:predicted acylesterase/phospholipase RssA
MVKKVALVLSGGVSLGSYIAGALDELLTAFAAAPDQYQIDIITGASAGATSAALIAHGLLYRGGQTELRPAWVDKVDITDLLAPDIPRGEPLSLLNSRRIREVARESLAWDSAAPLRRAPFCASRLTVGMTLTNMTALPYASHVAQPSAHGPELYVQPRNAEQETFVLTTTHDPLHPVWDRLATVARASAAIPLVFPLVQLERQAEDPAQYPQPPGFAGKRRFWYCDGGAFNNLPVDLAWHYMCAAAGTDQEERVLQDRVVVVVNPWRPNLKLPAPTLAYPALLEQAAGLLGAMLNESSARAFQGEVVPRMPPPALAGAERGIPGLDAPPAAVLGRFALVMPAAVDARLRGNHLHALGAFLDRRFREYDFRRGAADARLVARATLGIRYPERPAHFYEPDSDPRLHCDLTGYAALGEIPSSNLRYAHRSVRQVFEAALDRRIDALLAAWDLPLPGLVEAPLDNAVKPLIKTYLRAQLPAAWDL